MSTKAGQALTGLPNTATDKASELLEDYSMQADALEMFAESKAEQMFEGDTRLSKAGQVGTVLTVVTLGLTIILGILVYSEVKTALPTPSDPELENASTNSTSTFSDAMELAPVIMIVLLAAVVLAVVQRFR